MFSKLETEQLAAKIELEVLGALVEFEGKEGKRYDIIKEAREEVKKVLARYFLDTRIKFNVYFDDDVLCVYFYGPDDSPKEMLN